MLVVTVIFLSYSVSVISSLRTSRFRRGLFLGIRKPRDSRVGQKRLKTKKQTN